MKKTILFAACLAASASLMAQTPVRQMTVTPTSGEAKTFIVSDIDEITFVTAGEYHVEATANDAERGSVKSGYYDAVGDIATFYATPTAGYRLSHWTIGETIIVQTDLKVRVTEDFNNLEITAVFVEDTKHNGHSYVDILGDGSVLWAAHNVGATNPEDYGDYFAWGEVETKNDYSWSTYKWGKTENALEKYIDSNGFNAADGFEPDNKFTLDLADDAAKYTWGAEWRMPTHEEQMTLFNNAGEILSWDFQKASTEEEEVGLERTGGYVVKNTTMGAVLFFPAAGYRYGSDLVEDNTKGHYWSTSLVNFLNSYGKYTLFSEGNRTADAKYFRCLGRSVRPVVTTSDILD